MKKILALALLLTAPLHATVPMWQNVPSTTTGTSLTYLSGSMKVYPSTGTAAASPAIWLDAINKLLTVRNGVNVSTVAATGIYSPAFYGAATGLTAIPSAQLTGGVPTNLVNLSTVTTAIATAVAPANAFISTATRILDAHTAFISTATTRLDTADHNITANTLALSTAVYTTGTQSIGGQKTFTSPVYGQTATDPGPRFVAQHASLPTTYFTEFWDNGKIVQARNTWSAGVTGVWISSSATETWIDSVSGGFDFKPRGVSKVTLKGDGNLGVGITNPTLARLTVENNTADTYAGLFQHVSAAGSSDGLKVIAGGNATDTALLVQDRTEAVNFLKIDGAGNTIIKSTFTTIATGGLASGVDTNTPLFVGGNIISHHKRGDGITSTGYVGMTGQSAANIYGYSFAGMEGTFTGTYAAGTDSELGFYTAADNTPSKKAVITSGGNMGVNNTTPQNKLSINGDVAIGAIDIAGAANLFITSNKAPGSYVLKVSSADGTNQFVTLGNGYVGIGVVPTYPFHVVGDSFASVLARGGIGVKAMAANSNPASGATAYGTTMGHNNSTDHGWIQSLGATANSLELNPQGGNVGVGSVNPTSKLYVAGSFAATGDSNFTSTTTVRFTAKNPSLTSENGMFSIISDSPGNMLSMGNYIDGAYGSWLQTKQPNNAGGTFPILLNPLGGPVGIGNTAPASLLTVGPAGDTGILSYPTLRIQGHDVTYGSYGSMILNTTGGQTGGARRYLVTNALYSSSFGIIRSVDAGTDPSLNNTGTVASGTADFTITNTGKIGLGNTDPDQKLTVAGNISTTGQFISSGTGSNYFAGALNLERPLWVQNNIHMGYGTGSGIATFYGATGAPATLASGVIGHVAIASIYNTYGLYLGVDPATGYSWMQAKRTDTATAYSLLINPVGGNVGIGVAAPTSTLEVNGNIGIKTYTETKSSAAVSTNYDVSWASGSVTWLTLNASTTLTFSSPVSGKTMTFFVKQGGAGSYTLTWPTILWPSGAAPTLTATAQKVDIITVVNIDGVYYGFVGGKNY